MTQVDLLAPRDPSAPVQVRVPERPARAAFPLLAALGLGLAAHLLTQGAGVGLNLALLTVLFGGVGVWGAARKGAAPSPEGLTLLGVAVAFAVGFTLRGVPPGLAALDSLGLLTALLLGAAFLRFPGLSGAGVGHLVGALFTAGLRLAYGPLALLERFPWARVQPRQGGAVTRAGIGVALTLPVLLVFGSLLGRADQGFGSLLSRLFTWNVDGVFQSGFTLALWVAFAGGLLYPAVLSLRPTLIPDVTARPRLGLVETGLPLGALSALFVAFVVTQLPYFLSGGHLPDGLTFATYIRQGFGELMTVAFLTLSVLLGAFALTRPDVRTGLAYRLLNLAVLLPLALVILSAANRWRLYTLAYGLSEIRVLGAAFLMWVVFTLAWLARGLWRGDVRHFAFPALLLGYSVLLGTTALDPAALIARVNVHRQTASVTNDLRSSPQRADVLELLRLGPGSVPLIVANLDVLTRGSATGFRQVVIDDLHDRYDAVPGLRGWNLASARAHALVRTLPPRSPNPVRSSD
ncbi:DUF4173 domain-containing protein [Deinococcus sp. KSM4-11]|uniref:DUF4153 domain-containing protein n=1 Tax=Deinococcus sp. KSM4-11 TaxID=2568654 RepID=UPI0010A4BE7A|nr:DUF4173 domain-containing protein [Deinococcus sp. KSM4-11]THF85037.1 DUF4173 domain-containing protein [Deinococcus sp. KSM4-11]